MLIGVAFSVGTLVPSLLVFAQNTTTTSAPVVQSSDALITAVTGIVIAIAGLVTTLVSRGLLDKRIGTAAVMAADASWAVKDNRQLIKDGMQNTYDIVKLASPAAAEAADRKLAPILDDASRKVAEYTPKVEKFAAIAHAMSKHPSDEIEAMEVEIPD
jgi:hypothetical protein